MPDTASPVKPGAHREAVLYRALNGAGAGPAPVETIRERAREAYERLEREGYDQIRQEFGGSEAEADAVAAGDSGV